MKPGSWIENIGTKATVIDELLYRIRFLSINGRLKPLSWFNPRRRSGVVTAGLKQKRLLFVDLTAGDDSVVSQHIKADYIVKCCPNLLDLIKCLSSRMFYCLFLSILKKNRSVFASDKEKLYQASIFEIGFASLVICLSGRMLSQLSFKYLYLTREKGLLSLAALVNRERGQFIGKTFSICLQHGAIFEDHMPGRCNYYGCFQDDYSRLLRMLGYRTFGIRYWNVPRVNLDPDSRSIYVAINSGYLCDSVRYVERVLGHCLSHNSILIAHPADGEMLKMAEKKGVDVLNGIKSVVKTSRIYYDYSTVGSVVVFDGSIFCVNQCVGEIATKEYIYEETCRIRRN
jgi:hypothetical protein